MNKTIEISGYSDDLVCVRGGGLDDEWGAFDSSRVVVLSTGDRFTVGYDRLGTWGVEHVHESGLVRVEIERCDRSNEDEDPDPYTDTATVTGPIEWVDCWEHWPPRRSDLLERVEGADFADCSAKQLAAIYQALTGRPAGEQ